MYSSILFSCLLLLTAGSAHVLKRDVCTVESLNDPLIDDVPTITAALTKCGDGGRIILAKGTTYTIRSPLDLSPCKACDVQINGLVQVSQDWDYWQQHTAVFTIPNASAVIIRSDGNTGLIDAQSLGLVDPSATSHAHIPSIFSISNDSYQVHIRDLKIQNVPGIAFHVTSGSSAVRFYGIDFQNAATIGYQVEQAQHIYVWNNTVRVTGSCFSVLPNSTNIQIEESACVTTRSSTMSSGVELQLLASTGFGWIRNIFVNKVKAIGSTNVVAFLASKDGGQPQTIEITNATFTDITIEKPTERAIYLEQDDIILDVTQVTFKNFKGQVNQESTLTCANANDVCEFSIEGWNVTISE